MLKQATYTFAAAAVVATVAALFTGAVSATSGQCIDGSNPGNFTYQWDGYNKITVATKNGKALCKDTKIYFSSFVMPDTWDGNGFNATAVPQTKHDAVSVTLKAKTKNVSKKLEVGMPDDCKNVQTDLYLAPEQTEVTWENRIGDRLIDAKHKKAVGECPVPPVEEPEVPVEEPETPVEEPETPAEEPKEILSESTVVPVEIPKTGVTGGLSAVVALAGTAATYAAVYRARK